ncbi:MAG TPA: winged helix-turn-helix domain-containing protein [Pseudomonadota bacterium]|nr:winged helix-turn-helix domain-containing protein [Pseudomonadota bacterium]
MALVLLVEDERAIAESLEFALRRDGFQVCHAATLAAAQAALGQSDLVVLDLMLPDGSGFDLLRDMRESGLRTPVIILSSREEEADRVAGLEGGADDYVTKPFSPREVVARVRAVLRRVAPSRPLTAASPVPAAPLPAASELSPLPRLSTPLIVDAETRRAFYKGNLLDLTRTEFDLLRALGSAPERVFTRQQLLDRIFGEGYAVTDRTIDAHIKALRKKLCAAGADPELIETERGVGYRLRDLD